MKTTTEFAGITLRNALKTAADLTASGKSAEELPQALGEALKVEGDKLKFLVAAMQLAEEKSKEKGKDLSTLRRVVVYSVAEGEKVPAGVVQLESMAYLAEYIAGPQPKMPDRRDSGRDGKRGKGGKRGRGPREGGERRGDNRPKGPQAKA